MWKLVKLGDNENVVIHLTKDTFTCGRNHLADIIILSSFVSRNHATIIKKNGGLYICDNNTCNGTYVNALRIEPQKHQELHSGDLISFGASSDNVENVLQYRVIKEDETIEISDSDGMEGSSQELDQMAQIAKDLMTINALSVPSTSSTNNELDSLISPIMFSDSDNENPNIINVINKQLQKISNKKNMKCNEKNGNNLNSNHSNVTKLNRHTCASTVTIPEESNSKLNQAPASKFKISNVAADSNENHPPPIKEEKICFPSYDESIVISDDDDDDNWNCSQLISNNKEKERVIANEELDPFLRIKKELAELDYLEEPMIVNHVPITLDKPPNSTMDVLKTLSDSTTEKTDEVLVNPVPPRSSTTQQKPKYVKPPIIEPPHLMIKLRNIKEKISNDNKIKGNSSTNASEKHDTSATRKRKLKELCKTTEKKKEKAKSPGKGAAKVKVSESRGVFLCDAPPQKRPKPSNSEVKKPTGSKRIPKLSFKDIERTNIERTNIERTETTSKIVSPDRVTRSSLTKLEKPTSLVKLVKDQNNIVAKSKPRQSFVNLDDIYKRIVKWSISWLNDSKEVPPVNARPAVPMQLSFNSFNDYSKIIMPLMLLELWENIFQTFRQEHFDPFRALHQSYRVTGDVMHWDFEYYLLKEQHHKIIKPFDYALLEFSVKPPSGVKQRSIQFCLALKVESLILNKQDLINPTAAELCQGVPYSKVNLTVLTSYNDNIQYHKSNVVIQQIANLKSQMKLFKTVKQLKFSPLLNRVIKPEIKDFAIESSTEKLIFKKHLNSMQQKYVLEATHTCISRKPGIYMIQGPPGTGKTRLIISLLLQILLSKHDNPTVLLTAPTNNAVDNMIVKLEELKHFLNDEQKQNVKALRIGPENSIGSCASGYKLSKMVQKEMLKKAGCKNLVNKQDRDAFLKRVWGTRYHYEYKITEEKLLYGANVICTTLGSSSYKQLIDCVEKSHLKFTCCIVDEATQCTEPECLLPIALGIDRFVLVGDPKQLPATVMNTEANKLGFSKSLFDRLSCNFNKGVNPIRMLDTQYRMHDAICKFPNKRFYGGKLKSMPMIKNHITPSIVPYFVFSIKENDMDDDRSYINKGEAKLIAQLISVLIKGINKNCQYNIGVLTPYQAQKKKIQEELHALQIKVTTKIDVNTVDSFQGQEKDIIIISCVRNNSNNFVQNERRLNVALTRAKQALYLICNYTLFKDCQILYDLREDAKRRKAILDVTQHKSFGAEMKKIIFSSKNSA